MKQVFKQKERGQEAEIRVVFIGSIGFTFRNIFSRIGEVICNRGVDVSC